jgi:hypothetical protein
VAIFWPQLNSHDIHKCAPPKSNFIEVLSLGSEMKCSDELTNIISLLCIHFMHSSYMTCNKMQFIKSCVLYWWMKLSKCFFVRELMLCFFNLFGRSLPVPRRHTPYFGQPDYRIYELNKRLQQRTEVRNNCICLIDINISTFIIKLISLT